MSGTKLDIGTKLREILLSDPAVKNLAKGGVLPVWTDVSKKSDFVLYRRGAYKRITNVMDYADECELYLLCGSKDYDRSVELAVAVDTAMMGSKDKGHFQIVELLDSDEDVESQSGVCFQVLKYRIY